jgi:hypothetical protein
MQPGKQSTEVLHKKTENEKSAGVEECVNDPATTVDRNASD